MLREQTGNRSLVVFDRGDEVTVQAGERGHPLPAGVRQADRGAGRLVRADRDEHAGRAAAGGERAAQRHVHQEVSRRTHLHGARHSRERWAKVPRTPDRALDLRIRGRSFRPSAPARRSRCRRARSGISTRSPRRRALRARSNAAPYFGSMSRASAKRFAEPIWIRYSITARCPASTMSPSSSRCLLPRSVLASGNSARPGRPHQVHVLDLDVAGRPAGALQQEIHPRVLAVLHLAPDRVVAGQAPGSGPPPAPRRPADWDARC